LSYWYHMTWRVDIWRALGACHIIDTHFVPSFLDLLVFYNVVSRHLAGPRGGDMFLLWAQQWHYAAAAGAYTRPLFGST